MGDAGNTTILSYHLSIDDTVAQLSVLCRKRRKLGTALCVTSPISDKAKMEPVTPAKAIQWNSDTANGAPH